MGPPPSTDQLLEMMDNPMFLQQMNEAMNNPAVIEMMQQNPMVRNNPMISEMLRNPEMRRMMFNPEMMRMQLQMQRAMNQGGGGMRMPGVTNTTPQQNQTGTQNQPSAQNPSPGTQNQPSEGFAVPPLFNPFQNLFGPGAANPFAPPPQSQTTSNTTATAGTDANAPTSDSTQPSDATQNPSNAPPVANQFASLFGTPPTGAGASGQPANPIAEAARNLMQNPEAMRAAMQMMGAMNGPSAANPFAAFAPPRSPASGTASPPPPNLFGPGGLFGAPPPQDNRPPEEVYEVQLRQLNEMGFYEFERNVAALRRSGGNVQGAIEYLLSGGL